MHAASPLLSMAMRSCSVIASFFDTASLREPMLVTVSTRSASSYRQMQPKSIGRSDFEAADHDLEDAAQIVTLADRARDPVQQIEAAQLQLQLRLRGFAFLCGALARVDQRIECNADVRDLARTCDRRARVARAARPGSCDLRDRTDRSRDAPGRISRCGDRRADDHSDEQQRGERRSRAGAIAAAASTLAYAIQFVPLTGRNAQSRSRLSKPVARNVPSFCASIVAIAGVSLTSLPIHCSGATECAITMPGRATIPATTSLLSNVPNGCSCSQVDRHADGAHDAAVVAADRAARL